MSSGHLRHILYALVALVTVGFVVACTQTHGTAQVALIAVAAILPVSALAIDLITASWRASHSQASRHSGRALAGRLRDAGKVAVAEAEYREAVRLDPGQTRATQYRLAARPDFPLSQ